MDHRNTQQPGRLVYTVRDALRSGAFTSRNKLYAAIARGKLRTFRDGRRRLISAEALHEYIRMRERESAGESAPRGGRRAK